MKTADFFSFDGNGRISIARSAPRRISGYNVYKKLAPGSWFKTATYDEYVRRYHAQLAELDPQATWDHLVNIAGPHEPVLLCWERTPLTPDNWCHRRMVARWFRDELGHDVEEMGQGLVDAMGKPFVSDQMELV